MRAKLLILTFLLAVLICTARHFSHHLPSLPAEDAATLGHFPPRTVEQLIASRDVLLKYAASNPVLVLLAWFVVYVGMQTCAVPGTLTLSVLAGSIWGQFWGIILVSAVNLVGSSVCFFVSNIIGRRLVARIWPEPLKRFEGEVVQRRHRMTQYVIFLRVTPVLPNTFINVASPVIGVPYRAFALGTLLGCLPNNFMAVSAGQRLGELNALSDLVDPRLMITGMAIAAIGAAGAVMQTRSTPVTNVITKESRHLVRCP